jgi:hypothetical protein
MQTDAMLRLGACYMTKDTSDAYIPRQSLSTMCMTI